MYCTVRDNKTASIKYRNKVIDLVSKNRKKKNNGRLVKQKKSK